MLELLNPRSETEEKLVSHVLPCARMAASVIRTLSDFGLATSLQPCFFPVEEEIEEDDEEDLREETEGSLEDEELLPYQTQVKGDLWNSDPSPSPTEATSQLLRFAELISNDVQRYFGRSQDPDACDIYAERSCPAGSGRQRYYADLIRMASSGSGDESEPLGPLAELFQEAQRKGCGLPMSQRRLPVSFWTEPCPYPLGSSTAVSLSTPVSTLSSSNTPVSMLSGPSTPGSILSGSNTPVSMLSNGSTTLSMLNSSNTPASTLSSSSTPDFSDLLAHWATDKDNPNDFHCDYQLP